MMKDELFVFLENLKKKRNLLYNLLDITKNQKKLLLKDDVENLITAIRERENLLVDIAKLDEGIETENSTVKEFYKLQEVKEVRNEIKQVIEEILQLDSDNTNQVESKLEQFSQEIRRLRLTKKGIGSYAQPVYHDESVFIDAKK